MQVLIPLHVDRLEVKDATRHVIFNLSLLLHSVPRSYRRTSAGCQSDWSRYRHRSRRRSVSRPTRTGTGR